MAPLKFEEHIREKLQEREIPPTPDVWNKLEARLEKETPNNGSNRLWYAISAGIAGLMVIGSLLFSEGDSRNNNSNTLVTVPEKPEMQNTKKSESLPKSNTPHLKQQHTPLAVEQPVLAEEQPTPRKVVQEPVLKGDEALSVLPVEQNAAAMHPPRAQSNESSPKSDPVNSSEAMAQEDKAREVADKLQAMQQLNEEITPEVIDALLAEAQREIQKKRVGAGASPEVDAAALLQEVEMDLERSFRDRVFDMLGDQFQKIRTAVAERNN